MTVIDNNSARPRMGKIARAVAYSGRSKSRLYEWAGEYAGLFKKDGKSTLVDFDVLDRILDALPAAEIKPAKRTSGTNSTRDIA